MQQGTPVRHRDEEITDRLYALMDEYRPQQPDRAVEHIKHLAAKFSPEAQQRFFHHWKQVEYDLFFTHDPERGTYAVDPYYASPGLLRRFILMKAAQGTMKDIPINGDRWTAEELYAFGLDQYGVTIASILPVDQIESVLQAKGSIYAEDLCGGKRPAYRPEPALEQSL